MAKTILEALEQRKFQPGQVKFSTSDLSDPHIQHLINAIAAHTNMQPQQIVDHINGKVAEREKFAAKAPLLHATITQNLTESELFNIIWKKVDLPTNAPKFKNATFFKLVRAIQSEHDEFWPLRSFIDKRRLTPKYEFVDKGHSLETAAATPTGTFIFNVHFMQKLLDYAHLKGLQPKGKKYKSTGGDIPDEYAYIEFLIMHEFMHYSNDDFHYQRIIPNANPKIINWVGDFRSNYLLVKSGYEQLPIGLYNDHINYDRQKEYIEMYRLVEAEFNKLNDEEKDEMSEQMDKQSDDHEPGNEEAKDQEGKPDDPMKDGKPSPSDIDKKNEETERQMSESKDQAPDERENKQQEPQQGQGQGNQGGGKNGPAQGVNYDNIRPTFNWATLIKRFLATVSKKTYETYAKPARRGAASITILQQTGSAAIKPAEKPADNTDAKLAFCFDASGSMAEVIKKVYANSLTLLKQPQFKNSDVVVLRYSDSHSIFKVNFARNAAVQIPDVFAKAPKYNLTAAKVFSEAESGGTNLSAAIAVELNKLTSKQWNVLIFIDSDNLYGTNFENLKAIINAKPKQVFVIFDSRATYLKFRQQFGGSTPNITYFE